MANDKFTATWVSHTSINDFLRCPRVYFLKHVYRDSKTNHKIKLVSPPLALGQAVHEVVESLSVLPVDGRFDEPLMTKFDRIWQKVSGKKGGFQDLDIENRYKERGKEMIRRIMDNPGPIKNLAVKIKEDLPQFWLSEKDNIILCGKIDWLEYLPDTDGVHIIDFKTSKGEEDPESLQLPIYHLLVHNCQKRKVSKASYWYLGRHDEPIEKTLPDLEEAHQQVLEVAKRLKLSRQLNKLHCPHENGCYACRPMEAILRGEAEFVGTGDFKRDLYILSKPLSENKERSTIL